MWNLKNKLVNITKEKPTHQYTEETRGSQRGQGSRKEQERGSELKGANNYL